MPTTFHSFPRLPAELRMQIWRELQPDTATLSTDKNSKDNIERRKFSSILHSCREAREIFVVATNDNTNKASTRTLNRRYVFCQPFQNLQGFFVNFEHDTIEIRGSLTSLKGNYPILTFIFFDLTNLHQQ
jgi:hypothetical protein